MSKTRGKALAGGKAKRKTRNRRGKSSPAVSSSTPETIGDFVLDEGLTPQQFVFVEEVCANPTLPLVHAARKAYPDQKEDSLRVTASENLTKPIIRAAIQRRLGPAVHKRKTSRDRVLQLLGDMLNADIRKCIGPDGAFLPLNQWPPEMARLCTGLDQEELKVGDAVVGRVVKPRFTNFLDILQMAAKVNKMLTDKVEHDVGGTLEQLLTKVHEGGG